MLKASMTLLLFNLFLMGPGSSVVYAEIENVPAVSNSLTAKSVPAAPNTLQFGAAEVPFPNVPVSVPATMKFLLEGPLSAAGSEELVGYWSFDDTDGSTVFDGSGFGNDGVLTSATLGEGRLGQGLILDGTGGLTVLNSESLNSLPGGFTLSAWIRSTSYPDFTTIFWKTDRHKLIHQLHFQVDGRLYAAMNQPEREGGFEGISPFVVPLNEWHYVAWTYDEKYHRFYDNGIEVFSAPFTDPWVGNDINLLIGYHPEISSANFRGIIDEARIYRGALSTDQIRRDMNRASLLTSSFELTTTPVNVSRASEISNPVWTHYIWDVFRDCEEESDNLDSCRD